jgi:hypothetical protein
VTAVEDLAGEGGTSAADGHAGAVDEPTGGSRCPTAEKEQPCWSGERRFHLLAGRVGLTAMWHCSSRLIAAMSTPRSFRDAPCPAARIQCQHREEVLGANLRWGVGRAVGRRVACGGVQRADRLGRHRWSLIVRDTGGRAEQPLRRGADRVRTHVEAFEDSGRDALRSGAR